MTILIDGRSLVDPNAGGVTRVTRGLLPPLFSALRGHRFVLVTSGRRRPTLPIQLPDHVIHKHIRLPNKLWSTGAAIGAVSLDRWFRDDRPDLLLLPNLGFVGRPAIPYALIVHDISFLIEPRWFSRKARWWHRAVHAKQLIRRATKLFAVSERTKHDLMNLLAIPENRITVIPLGLPDDVALMNLPPQLTEKRFILALGAGDPRKNAGCAIKAIEFLRQDPKFADVMLVLVGAGRANAKFAPTMILHRPADVALNTLMKHASAFLYPSWYEGFGLPLHETARFATPCIASTAGALPETAPAGTLFAPPGKPHLWAKALEEILAVPEKNKTATTIADWSKAAQIMAAKLT